MGGRRKGEGKRREGEGTEWEERKSRGKDEIIKRENRQREVGRKRGGRKGRARIQFTRAVY